jgi:hypothetical protein
MGTKTANMSAIYGYHYQNITLNVGKGSAVYALNVTSGGAYMPNGSLVPALSQWKVPTLASLSSGDAKCFVYNMTLYPLVNAFVVKIEYYKIVDNEMSGFLILSNKARGSGKFFLLSMGQVHMIVSLRFF